MKIAIDCRPLQNRYASRGIGTVVRNLLTHLVKSRCSSSLVLCGKTVAPPLRCSSYRMLRRGQRHDWLWEQVRWPFDLWGMGASVLHSTVSLGMLREIGLPLFAPAMRIATVYDLNPLTCDGLAPHARMKSYLIQKRAVRTAARVITISHFVKNDLVTLLKVNEKSIRVLPLAVDETIAKAFDNRRVSAVSPPDRYILAMGEDENKNIVTSIKVFKALLEKGFPGTLRIIGESENQTGAVKKLLSENPALNEKVIFSGVITPEQVMENYAACSLFLFPSLSEGFGLPVLEAMYCGAPVIASNATSLPEAGGDAALYAAPDDVEALAGYAEHLLADDAFRKLIVDKGNKRARKHTWAEAAEMVVSLYEELGARFGQQPL